MGTAECAWVAWVGVCGCGGVFVHVMVACLMFMPAGVAGDGLFVGCGVGGCLLGVWSFKITLGRAACVADLDVCTPNWWSWRRWGMELNRAAVG